MIILYYNYITTQQTEKIEQYLEKKLKEKFSWFDMTEFLMMLK